MKQHSARSDDAVTAPPTRALVPKELIFPPGLSARRKVWRGAWGVFNRACAGNTTLAEALAVARGIASNGPLAVRQAKKSIHYGLQTDLLSGYRFAVEAYNHRVDTDDRREGVRAFNEKREPVFQGK